MLNPEVIATLRAAGVASPPGAARAAVFEETEVLLQRAREDPPWVVADLIRARRGREAAFEIRRWAFNARRSIRLFTPWPL